MFFRLKRLVNGDLHQTLFLDPFCIKTKDGKSVNYLTKEWTNPVGKMQILGVLSRCVYGLKRLLFFLELHQAFVLIYFSLKQKIEKVSIFLKKYHGLTSFESCKFCPFFNRCFYILKRLFF